MSHWKTVLETKDKKGANELVDKISIIRRDQGESFEKFALAIGYATSNVWFDGELNPHFRRILVELKILAISGKTTFYIR